MTTLRPAAAPISQSVLVISLGITQTLAWASSYYLVAILGGAMAADAGTSPTLVMSAVSAALLVSAALGPAVGRTIDRLGARSVLVGSNLVFAAALVTLGLAQSAWVLWLGWLLMGVGMGIGLYDTAFAALGRIYKEHARPAITGLSLIAGFASTVGWPLTAWGEASLGWRATCFAWAAAHVLLAIPIHLMVLPPDETRDRASAPTKHEPAIGFDRTMALLSVAFAAGWVVSTALAAHLPRLLEAAGATSTQAIAAAALVGPAQVGARLIEFGLLRGLHPLWSARASTLLHPLGALLLLASGSWLAAPFVLLHGAGNGILTIARGAVPLAVFGPRGYGARLGLIGAPARIAQAFAPVGFGLLIDQLGAAALIFSTLLCLLAALSLFAIRLKAPAEPARVPVQG